MHDHSRPGSLLADSSAAEEAVSLVMPMIESGLASRRVGDSGFLHIVIMDPGRPATEYEFEEAILYERSAGGDPSTWDADYALYAKEKARVCWRHARSGHEIRACSPHLLRATDTGVWGGIWLDGIAVGISGADPWFDEAIAYSVAASLRAVAKKRALHRSEALWLAEDGKS